MVVGDKRETMRTYEFVSALNTLLFCILSAELLNGIEQKEQTTTCDEI